MLTWRERVGAAKRQAAETGDEGMKRSEGQRWGIGEKMVGRRMGTAFGRRKVN